MTTNSLMQKIRRAKKVASESKKRKIMPRNKKGVAFDGGKMKGENGHMKGVAKFSSSQRQKEERNWRKDYGI